MSGVVGPGEGGGDGVWSWSLDVFGLGDDRRRKNHHHSPDPMGEERVMVVGCGEDGMKIIKECCEQ